MQIASSQCFVKSSLAPKPQTRPAHRSLAVRCSAEESTRRATISSILVGTAALFSSASAQAKVKNPAQDSLKRGGSSTQASMSSFDMEDPPRTAQDLRFAGIKKRGIKAGQRRELLDEAKAKAQQLANKATP